MMSVKRKNFINGCARFTVVMLTVLVCNAPLFAANKGKKPAVTQVKPKTVAGQLSISDVIGQVVRDRQELEAMREKYMQEYAQKGMQGNCMQLTGKITQATVAYVSKRIAETVKKVGPAPTKFSVFTMGSMARDESGFFTDLEIGILVAKKDAAVLNYFKRFSQALADRFFKLGEHPDVGGKGMRIDEGDNAPEHLRWYARYASPEQAAMLNEGEIGKGPYEGSRIFVATPQAFADLLDPNLPKKLANIADVVMPKKEKDIALGAFAIARNIRHLYGDKILFDQYVKARDKYLQGPPQDATYHKNRREELSYYLLKFDAAKHSKPGSAIAEGKLGDIIDPKRTLYRFPEQVLTSLGFLYNAGVQNTAQIADKLVAMKRMSPQWGNALKDLMNFTLCLRLRKQIQFGKQGLYVPVTQKGYNELKQLYTNDLVKANKSLTVATAAQNIKSMMQAEEDMLKAKVNIKDLDKLIPGKPDSILTPEIITLLNTKYLPLEKKLLETLNTFTAGDRDAFLGTDVGIQEPVKKAVPVKPVVVKKPVKRK